MTDSASPQKPRRAAGIIRRVVMWLSVAVLVILLIPLGLGWLSLWAITHPPCSGGPLPGQFGLVAEEIAIPSHTGTEYAGYFISGENGATIIIPPAYTQGRGGWLHEAAVLVRHGYSVLTYDSRLCSGFGVHSLGIWETEDIQDALDYLRSRGDVDLTHIGVHGFSQAGASNLFAAARMPEIRAVVAEGGYITDYGAQTLGIGMEQDAFTTLYGLGGQLGYRSATGMSMARLRPIDVIADIAPRRVLLVYGQYEVTLAGAQQIAGMFDHVTLWEVPGATHGSYLSSAGEADFAQHVVGFFDSVLLDGS